LRISDKYSLGAKARDIRPQTKTPRNGVSVFSRGIVLPEVQAYDCTGIEWFAWKTDLVWVRIILARLGLVGLLRKIAGRKNASADCAAWLRASPRSWIVHLSRNWRHNMLSVNELY